jgi:hypothetical protein
MFKSMKYPDFPNLPNFNNLIVIKHLEFAAPPRLIIPVKRNVPPAREFFQVACFSRTTTASP